MKFLTTPAEIEEARLSLCDVLASRGEWFCEETCAQGSRTFELRAGEWEVSATRSALRFSCWTQRGARAWRVAAWEWSGGSLRLRATRRMGAERATLELIPRASAHEGLAAVAAARRAACERFANVVCSHLSGARIESAKLSAGARRCEPGRYARILIRRGRHELIAATCAVVAIKHHEIDAMLASALAWWSRLSDGAGGRAQRGSGASKLSRDGATRRWLVVARELSEATASRLALLRAEVREAISLFEWCDTPESACEVEARRKGEAREVDAGSHTGNTSTENSSDAVVDSSDAGATARSLTKRESSEHESLTKRDGLDERKSLREIEVPRLASLLDSPVRFRFSPRAWMSETAAQLVALAPAEIDVIRARHGETLRFRGLAFARVRRLPDGERVWFGVPGAGQKLLLDAGNWRQLAKLIDELAAHRRADAVDPRHAYFRAAPEAWLESIVRREITRLDPGLIVSPLHVQFRTARETAGTGSRPVDLLALRHDGRLVIVELKVSEDAALPLQGADYWRRVETHRRSGDIVRARLFGELEIADEPPLVYLVAPVFRFHRAFQHLARMVSPEIEMFRFDINEDWRACVHVVRRTRVN